MKTCIFVSNILLKYHFKANCIRSQSCTVPSRQ